MADPYRFSEWPKSFRRRLHSPKDWGGLGFDRHTRPILGQRSGNLGKPNKLRLLDQRPCDGNSALGIEIRQRIFILIARCRLLSQRNLVARNGVNRCHRLLR